MADPNTPPSASASDAGTHLAGTAQIPQQQPRGSHQNQGILPPGTLIPSAEHPGGRSLILDEQPDLANRRLTEERITRDWEYCTVARPVDLHEKVYEVPTVRTVQTVVPRIQVREVIKTIKKDVPQYVETQVEVPHTKIVDKYVEVPVVSGTEIKYVPKIEVRERTVKVTKPEIKWVEKIVEVPQIKEVVRYIESDKNVEQVIRYVPKGQAPFTHEDVRAERESREAREAAETFQTHGVDRQRVEPGEEGGEAATGEKEALWTRMQKAAEGPAPGIYTPRSTVPLSQMQTGAAHGPGWQAIGWQGSGGLQGASGWQAGEPASIGGVTGSQATGEEASRASWLPKSPRIDRMEQLFIPRITRTVEVEKEIPVTVDVPVPFMVPRPVQVPVEVPVLRFRDHFVPVPIRRHVIPKILFTEEVYEVDCTREKPVLVVEDYFKPVPVDVKIKLKEKDIKIIPIDPAELSQADFHAMWMRVNADLLERVRSSGREVELFKLEEQEGEEEVKDPTLPDLGPLPLHPGHPLMMTWLQAQWIQNASTVTHNMYTPEFFRMHASALDSLLHPQPHQVNITLEQSSQLGPLPAEQMPSPWGDVKASGARERQRRRQKDVSAEGEPTYYYEEEEEEHYSDDYVRRAMCSPCCEPQCSPCCTVCGQTCCGCAPP